MSFEKVVLGDITLYRGDCLEIMPTLEAGSILVADPPYGINENSDKNTSRGGFSTAKWKHANPKDYGDYSWDKERKIIELQEALNICSSAVVFGGNYYTDILPPSMGWIIWDKMNTGDFADCELAWTSYNKATRIFRYLWNGFIKQKPEERYHPTQKPLALMLWVLENYTNPNEIILDPFMGSGTTLVACVQTGRKGIGIEIDPGYFEIAVERVKKAQLQIRMDI